jgi:cytochrome P450
LRDLAPVHFLPERGVWSISRFADVQDASRNWGAFSSVDGTDLDDFGLLAGSGTVGRGVFIDADPPQHDVLRNLVRHAFLPNAVKELAVDVRRRIGDAVSSVAGAGEVDAIAHLIIPIAVGTIAALLGVPKSDEPEVARLIRLIERREPGSLEIPVAAREALHYLGEYTLGLARARRLAPRSDLISAVAAARIGDKPLADDEIAGIGNLMFIAGTETTISLLGSMLVLLFEHPDQRELGRCGEVDSTAVIEEVLRFESPVQWLARTATCDTRRHGVTIPEGGRVVLLHGSANRDERRYSDPDRFNIQRTHLRNVAFGDGIHHCLGAPIARMEARLFLESLFACAPNYELAGPRVREHTQSTRSYAELRATFA